MIRSVQQIDDPVTRPILSDHGAEDALPSHGDDIPHHVPGTAQCEGLASDVHDGDGGFRTHPPHVSPQVFVQHHVAHHEEAQPPEAGNQSLEPPPVETSHQRARPRTSSSRAA
jgi:hypothetical protein